MFCNFCGGKIDKSTMKCAGCGKAVGALSGGNSFRDIVDGRLAEREARAQYNEPRAAANNDLSKILSSMEEIKSEVRHSKKPGVLQLAAFVLAVITLVSVFTLPSAVGRRIRGVEGTLAVISDDITDMKNAETSEMEMLPPVTPVPLPTPEPTPAFVPTEITKHPGDEEISIGGSGNVFIVNAEGEGLQFTWLKYIDNEAVWKELQDGVDAYGIVNGPNSSTLRLTNAEYVHGGMYICRIADASGQNIYSMPVQLRITVVNLEETAE